jgi:hypothetical protein
MGGLGHYVCGGGTCTWHIFLLCVTLVCGIVFDHNPLRDFSLGLGKLNPEVIRKSYPINTKYKTNTTIFFITHISLRRRVSTFIKSSSGLFQKKRSNILWFIMQSGIHNMLDLFFWKRPDDDFIKVETCRLRNICVIKKQKIVVFDCFILCMNWINTLGWLTLKLSKTNPGLYYGRKEKGQRITGHMGLLVRGLCTLGPVLSYEENSSGWGKGHSWNAMITEINHLVPPVWEFIEQLRDY